MCSADLHNICLPWNVFSTKWVGLWISWSKLLLVYSDWHIFDTVVFFFFFHFSLLPFLEAVGPRTQLYIPPASGNTSCQGEPQSCLVPSVLLLGSSWFSATDVRFFSLIKLESLGVWAVPPTTTTVGLNWAGPDSLPSRVPTWAAEAQDQEVGMSSKCSPLPQTCLVWFTR